MVVTATVITETFAPSDTRSEETNVRIGAGVGGGGAELFTCP